MKDLLEATETDPLCVSVRRACVELGDVGRTTIYDLMTKGEIEGLLVAARRVITMSSIRDYIERQRRAEAS